MLVECQNDECFSMNEEAKNGAGKVFQTEEQGGVTQTDNISKIKVIEFESILEESSSKCGKNDSI